MVCRFSQEYRDAARNFVNLAHESGGNDDIIVCPCTQCKNLVHHHYDVVYEHLVIKGMDPTYTTWVLHGERPSTSNWHVDDEMGETINMYRDHIYFQDGFSDHSPKDREEEAERFVGDGDRPLYFGCSNYTKMSATVALFKHKVIHGLSDNSFNELLQLIRHMLPLDNLLPDSFYAIKNLLKKFDLKYQKIHACVNDCVLFRKELEDVKTCPVCNSSRWKIDKRTNKIDE